MKTIVVKTPFVLTIDKDTKMSYGVGVHRVEDVVADHWYTSHHIASKEEADEMLAKTSGDAELKDVRDERDRLRRELDDLTVAHDSLKDQHAKSGENVVHLTTELDAARVREEGLRAELDAAHAKLDAVTASSGDEGTKADEKKADEKKADDSKSKK